MKIMEYNWMVIKFSDIVVDLKFEKLLFKPIT